MTKHSSQQRLWAVVIAVVAVAVGIGAGLLLGRGHHTQDADASAIGIGFAQDMSAHHQQALAMCDMMPPDIAPDVRGLVNQIRITQWREIGQMMGWLQVLDAPLDNPHPMSWMHSDDDHHNAQHAGMDATAMPGMANSAELTGLATARGRDAEIRFLQLMIRHHQGGVDMAARAASEAGDQHVRETAFGMVKDQTEEIQIMVVMLDRRGAQVLPYP